MKLRVTNTRGNYRTLHWAFPGFCGMASRDAVWFRVGRRGPGATVKHIRHYEPAFNGGPYGRRWGFVAGPVVAQLIGSYRIGDGGPP